MSIGFVDFFEKVSKSVRLYNVYNSNTVNILINNKLDFYMNK